VLVEDTLEHQKAARRVGMGTVWMRRWIGGQHAHRPGYVCARIRSLQALARWR
jgi:putative hydrolase of the HAD superfamily